MTGREGVRLEVHGPVPVTPVGALPTEPAMPAGGQTQGGAWLKIPTTVKSLRETLAVSQTEVCNADAEYGKHARLLGDLIDQLDVLRPLGPDGVHGDQHTPFCGCER